MVVFGRQSRRADNHLPRCSPRRSLHRRCCNTPPANSAVQVDHVDQPTQLGSRSSHVPERSTRLESRRTVKPDHGVRTRVPGCCHVIGCYAKGGGQTVNRVFANAPFGNFDGNGPRPGERCETKWRIFAKIHPNVRLEGPGTEMTLLCGWHQIIGISREVEFSGCPGTRQCLGLRGDGYKSQGRAWARPLLFLCSSAGSFSCVVQREVLGRRVLRGVCRLLANPPFAKKKKKKKKGRCASTAASLATATYTKPCGESTDFTLPKKLVESTLEAWNLGVVPQYPPCPNKRFRLVSWQTADRSVFSSKPRLSAFVRSWTSKCPPRCPGNAQQPNRPSLSRLLKLQSGAQPARRWPAKRGGCRCRWSFVRQR